MWPFAVVHIQGALQVPDATLEQNIDIWRTLHEQGYFEHHPRYQDRLHDRGVGAITQRLDLDPSHTLLEIGCGYGRLLWHLAPRVGRVLGIEVASEPVQAARELLHERVPGCYDIFVGDGSTLRPVDDASVDRVCAFTVFQHLTRPGVQRYLEETQRVLREGGLACFQFFCQPGSQVEFRAEPREQSISMSVTEIAAMLESAGLRIESIDRDDLAARGMGDGSYWWWWAVASKTG